MTDDQARQDKPENEPEFNLSDGAIEDLEPDNSDAEAVKGGTLNIGSQSSGAGAGKITL